MMWNLRVPALVLLQCFIAVVTSYQADGDSKNIACYYVLEDPAAVTELQPEFIDPSLCTHIILAFATVVNDSLIPGNPYDVETYQKIMAFKSSYPDLKVMLSAGGGNSASNFPEMVKTPESRASFINQSIPMMLSYGFDGFDIDWEFPAYGGDPLEDKDLFTEFLKEFRDAIDSLPSPHNTFLLSVDVAAVRPITEISYNISEMAKYVDFINIMCYDYHDFMWYEPITNYNSPLFNRSDEVFFDKNIAWTGNYYVEKGMPKSKIHIGLPTYGHTYKLLDPTWNTVHAPCTSSGIYGGSIPYPPVCQMIKTGSVVVFDDECKVPYTYQDYDWISYEDVASITAKCEWVQENGFAGVMTFDLNCDDWAGTCDGKTTFPLHRVMRQIIRPSSGPKWNADLREPGSNLI